MTHDAILFNVVFNGFLDISDIFNKSIIMLIIFSFKSCKSDTYMT